MKKLIGLLLVVLTVLSLMPVAMAAESGVMKAGAVIPEGTTVTIVNCNYFANVRARATSNSRKLGVAKKGEVFPLLDLSSNGKWYKIQYTSSTVGYVFHKYVKASADVEPGKEADVKPVAEGTKGTIVRCSSCTAVRARASSSSRKLGTAAKGDVYTVKGTKGSWVLIDYDGIDGFVYKRYISFKSSGESEKEDTTPKTATITYSKHDVNIHAGNKSTTAVIGIAKKGESFTVLGTASKGKWIKIDFNGQTGYVYWRYVKVK